MLTNRYIFVPIIVFDEEKNPRQDEEGNYITTAKRLSPLRVESYSPYPTMVPSDPNQIQDWSVTQVTMYSGHKHLLDMSVDLFEETMDAWK